MAHVDLLVAEHEAAHVVVGLALDLRLRRAMVEDTTWRGWQINGFTWFGDLRKRLAHGILACAGLAWEARPGGNPDWAAGDLVLAREYLRTPIRGGSTAQNVRTGCTIAAGILAARKGVHRKLAEALCDGPLGPREIAALVLE